MCVWVINSSLLPVQQESHQNFWQVFLPSPAGPQKPPQGHAGLQRTRLPSHHKAWKKVLSASEWQESLGGTGCEQKWFLITHQSLLRCLCLWGKPNLLKEHQSEKWQSNLPSYSRYSNGFLEKRSKAILDSIWNVNNCFSNDRVSSGKGGGGKCFSFTSQHKQHGSSYNM